MAGIVIPSVNASRNIFASDIYEKIATGKQENVIFSPASIHTCLGIIFFASAKKTEEELRRALRFETTKRDDIAQNAEEFIKSSFKKTNNDDEVQLNMANRIYVNQNLKLNSKFNEISQRAFQSTAENINFADSRNAVQKINHFVEENTQNKIKNLLSEESVTSDTSVVLVNAIYFKGKWATPFSAAFTSKKDFWNLGKTKVPVDFMFMDEEVRYGEFPELDAKVLELPYKNSDISMLILLPNNLNGLDALEKKLNGKDFNKIVAKLATHEVVISLPKFRIEYDVDLKKPLEELGLETMFTDDADFSELLESDANQKVSEVKHKAFIDVNEAGSEAAAATFMKIVPMSAKFDQKYFKADHPFVFVIRDSKAVYFAGHVVNL